jgi:FAD:protein FMN transferase
MAPAGIGIRTFPALGTVASVLVTEPDAAERARALLAAELDAIDLACSRFRADSELWRLNHTPGRWVPASPLLAEALAVALDAARITAGDVDPTCGSSMVRLGYDTDFARARLVTAPLREPATPAPGWQRVELDTGHGLVRIPAGLLLDLGATAKALAADRAASAIATALGCGVLVNLGGGLRVAGDPPAGGWWGGIDDDLSFGAASPAPAQVVVITGGAVATSSTKARSWRRGLVSLHHIIVPRTGLPAGSCWRTVSVAAASCVDANTASTAAILRGGDAPGWLAGQGLPARLVTHGGQATTVGGWPAGSVSTGSRS